MEMKEKQIEILAPAGSYEAFRAAVAAGADAVYAGGQRFGARANAENFTQEELIRAIQEAHLYDRKFYLTVNTLLKDNEITELYDYLAPYYENGLDAVIVQDMGVLEFVREYFPDMDIHASTQMTVTGPWGSEFLEAQGVTRVVPARELSLEEIRSIHDRTKLEIECFVHGALCYCYSGQCLLSSLIGGRSGNRGRCAQPCRQIYSHEKEKAYYLSPKDICTLELIPELIEAGIYSFKIEGRMKKPEYVAGVTSMYRKYTDLYLRNGKKGFSVDPIDRECLMDLYNRGGSSTGYYQAHNGKNMMSLSRPNHAGVPAVKVTYQKGREVKGTVLTDLNPGDVLEINGRKGNYTLGSPVRKGESFSFLVQKNTRLLSGTVLNRIRNEALIHSLNDEYTCRTKQIPVSAVLTLHKGTPGILTVVCKGMEVRVNTEEPIQQAISRPVDESRVRAQITKTGASEFYFKKLDIVVDEDIFLPMQQLNLLRRQAFDELKRILISGHFRELPHGDHKSYPENKKCRSDLSEYMTKYSVFVQTVEQAEALCDYICSKRDLRQNIQFFTERICININLYESSVSDSDMSKTLLQLYDSGCEVYLTLPYIFRKGAEKCGETLTTAQADPAVAGVVIRNCEQFGFLKSLGFDKTIILDHNLYVFNRYAKRFWNKLGVFEFTAPLELNKTELSELGLSDCELTVYERFPVMLSAQCVTKNHSGCIKKPGISVLIDRFGNQYPVQRCCDLCYNIMYNDLPLYLGEEAKAVRELSPGIMGIRFTIENKKEVAQILSLITEKMDRKRKSDTGYDFHYTEGHFKRGIL